MYHYKLTEQEQAATGFTDKFVIDYTDLNTTAGTGKAVVLCSYAPGFLFSKAAYRVITAWDGTSTTNLTLDVGHNGGTTDDDDSLLNGYEIHNDATETLYADGNGAAFATLRTGYAAADSGNIEATFTATGANLTDLTSGSIAIYLSRVDLTKV